VKSATNDSTEEACKCILEYYTSIICGFFSVAFFIENSEEGRFAILHKFFFPPRNLGGVCPPLARRRADLPFFINSSSLPLEILEECARHSLVLSAKTTFRDVPCPYKPCLKALRINKVYLKNTAASAQRDTNSTPSEHLSIRTSSIGSQGNH
jgi:hypothetical protein